MVYKSSTNSGGGGSGSGDVTGPSSAIAGHLAVFADGTGKVISDGGAPGGLAAIAAYSTLSNNTNASAVPIAVQSFILGIPSFAAAGAASQMTKAVDGTYQYLIQNSSATVNASTDFVATADDGTDTTKFIDMGINGSTYSVGSWTINSVGDGYLYTSDGELAIGTAANKAIDFFTGGTLLANKRMSISGAGAFTLGGIGIDTSNNITGAGTIASGNHTITGTETITSASATAFTVGLAGATNPALAVDASTASSATGLRVKSAAAAGGLAIDVQSSGTNENLTINAKGSGTITFGSDLYINNVV